MIKRVFTIVFIAILLFSFSACDADNIFFSISVDDGSETSGKSGSGGGKNGGHTDKTIYEYSEKEAVTNKVSRLPYDDSVPIEDCRRVGAVGADGKVVKINNVDRVGSLKEATNDPIAFTQDLLDVFGAWTYKSMDMGERFVEFCTVENCIIYESSFETSDKLVKAENISAQSVQNAIKRSLNTGIDRVTGKTCDYSGRSDYEIVANNDKLRIDLGDVDTSANEYQLAVVCDVKVVRVYTIKASVDVLGGMKETYSAVYKCTEIVQTGPSRSVWFKAP